MFKSEAVVGAGVIALSIARALAARGLEVLVLEQEAGIGQATSWRNSEVPGSTTSPGASKPGSTSKGATRSINAAPSAACRIGVAVSLSSPPAPMRDGAVERVPNSAPHLSGLFCSIARSHCQYEAPQRVEVGSDHTRLSIPRSSQPSCASTASSPSRLQSI